MKSWVGTAFVVVILLVIAFFTMWKKPVRDPACWEAPYEATRGITSGHWEMRESGPPFYCIEWLGEWDAEKRAGRATLMSRCWPAKPMSEEACKREPPAPKD